MSAPTRGLPRPRFQGTSQVGAGMGSNPIRSHLIFSTNNNKIY